MGKHRDKLIEMLDDGVLDPEQLAINLLGWLSEDECKEFAQRNDIELFPEEEEEEEPLEYEFNTEEEVNELFLEYWQEHCKDVPAHTNDKPAKREAFTLFVDGLHRDGSISDELAFNVTMKD